MKVYFKGLSIDLKYTPGDPGVRTFRNGDPGYPGTGGEIEIKGVTVEDADEWREWSGVEGPLPDSPELVDYLTDWSYDELADLAESEIAP